MSLFSQPSALLSLLVRKHLEIKAFPIEEDEHLLAVRRYVQRNPLRAKRCDAAEDWPCGSGWRTAHSDAASGAILADWPIKRPRQ